MRIPPLSATVDPLCGPCLSTHLGHDDAIFLRVRIRTSTHWGQVEEEECFSLS